MKISLQQRHVAFDMDFELRPGGMAAFREELERQPFGDQVNIVNGPRNRVTASMPEALADNFQMFVIAYCDRRGIEFENSAQSSVMA